MKRYHGLCGAEFRARRARIEQARQDAELRDRYRREVRLAQPAGLVLTPVIVPPPPEPKVEDFSDADVCGLLRNGGF